MNLRILNPIKNNPSRSGIFNDIDGTMSKITETPGEASVDDGLKAILKKIAKRYKVCGVISGRSVQDALGMIGLPELFYSGNHGLETLWNGEYSSATELDEYCCLFRELAKESKFPKQVEIENKGLALAFHFRKRPDMKEHLYSVLQNLAGKHSLQLSEGKMVYELKPNIYFNKGDIIDKVVKDFSLGSIFYAGDDMTDLSALEAAKRHNGVAVGICDQESPEQIKTVSTIYVNSVDEFKNVLRYLIE